MLWIKKKKRQEEENKKDKIYEEEFVIPQIPNEPFTLKDANEYYEKSRFVSPMFGDKVKDIVVIPKNKIDGDIGKRYDAFRDEKDKFVKKEQDNFREFKNTIITKEYIRDNLGHEYVERKEEPVILKEEKEEELFYGIGVSKEQFLNDSNLNYENEKISSVNDFSFDFSIDDEKIENNGEDILNNNVIEEVKEFNFSFNEEEITNEKEIINEVKENFIKEKVEPKKSPIIHKSFDKYQLPPKELLKKGEEHYMEKEPWIDDHIEIINNTLNEFGIDGKVVNYTKGPAITRYEVKLEPGINVKKVSSIEDNIKMALAAKYLNIQAPIPGKPNVGIEVSNKVKEIVRFGNICDTNEFKYNENPLFIGIGKDIEGNNLFMNLQKAPHALVAGQTGSGKSVFINTMLISLLLKNKPDDLKLLLVDPKKVELSAYNDLPHLLTPVIDDPKMASTALKWLVNEMENRYQMFVDVGAKDIKTFNEKIKYNKLNYEKMPYIVVVIDELADLMQTTGPDVEESIQRITQKARAAGIHMVVATQRPTTDVVKGTIKSNIPTRIAFKMASHIDSSTILDRTGAEGLLGEGDVLLRLNDEIVRGQGAYISDDEIYKVTSYIKEQANPDYLFTHEKLKKREEKGSFEDLELLKSIAYYVVENQTASINRILKAFNVGFNKAQRIVEQLEELEIVGPSVGTKARDVLVELDGLEVILNGLEDD